jgi:hypothetical protein
MMVRCVHEALEMESEDLGQTAYGHVFGRADPLVATRTAILIAVQRLLSQGNG